MFDGRHGANAYTYWKVKRHTYVPIVNISACGDCFFM